MYDILRLREEFATIGSFHSLWSAFEIVLQTVERESPVNLSKPGDKAQSISPGSASPSKVSKSQPSGAAARSTANKQWNDCAVELVQRSTRAKDFADLLRKHIEELLSSLASPDRKESRSFVFTKYDGAAMVKIAEYSPKHWLRDKTLAVVRRRIKDVPFALGYLIAIQPLDHASAVNEVVLPLLAEDFNFDQ